MLKTYELMACLGVCQLFKSNNLSAGLSGNEAARDISYIYFCFVSSDIYSMPHMFGYSALETSA